MKKVHVVFILCLVFLVFLGKTYAQIKFAAFGDYGNAGPKELAVSQLVQRQNPNFIVTLGDNNYYPDNQPGENYIDENIGQYYHSWIYPYNHPWSTGYGQGAADSVNKFFPCIGNHDVYYGPWNCYYRYFANLQGIIIGNPQINWWDGMRYYKFQKGNCEFFLMNSGEAPVPGVWSPDSLDSNSTQAQWLKSQLATSTARWKIVVLHHPPYQSFLPGYVDYHKILRWPYKAWGASVILTGHNHLYESLVIDSLSYFICGLGGAAFNPCGGPCYPPVDGSRIQYNEEPGSLFIRAYNDSLVFDMINVSDSIVDHYRLPPIPRSDVDKNGVIDLTDVLFVYNDMINFFTGYSKTDVNLDHVVDLVDLSIVFNDSQNN